MSNQALPIKLCVIDDIPTVVRGLTTKMDWEAHGITVAATALDGEEGLRLIREVRPDIIVTDIRMPYLDGIEMMKRIQEEFPWMKLIYMSGYTDFSYAQEAVRLGAFDYIVKPFTKQEVLDAVLAAKEEILREREMSSKMADMELKLRESLPFLRQEYMKLLVRYGSTQTRLRQQWEFLNIDMKENEVVAMVAEIDQFAERTKELPVNEVELIRFAVQNILEETVSTHTKGIVFRESIDQFVMVVNPPGGMDCEALAELCRENISRYTHHTISIGLGTLVNEAWRVSVSYERALAALTNSFYAGGDSVYRYTTDHASALPYLSPEKEKALFYCLRSGNGAKSVEQLQDIWEDWSHNPPEPEMMRALCSELSHAMLRIFVEKATEQDKLLLEARLADIIKSKPASFTDMQRRIEDFCGLGCSIMTKRQHSDARHLIGQAVEYIELNLHRNLTAQECAQSVHLSPSYFSSLFKKEMGQTLAQYIIGKRMDRAKEMVLEGKQVQDIALALGYEDRPYFSELFKRHTGMTPTEFRTHYST
ncbi:response regulator [Paenibacillus sp. GD4]|jgi:two-component system, response regulator YesN|uniref:response regulator n=1 Tax=Paenibacillus sp. GD4 TaxID=3068890 RepID=UPI0027968A11|nr:response regulator [Paenibacillus sp. GD4]MDQ1912705.1 response regulator [Paenibacillus sp. GD4]